MKTFTVSFIQPKGKRSEEELSKERSILLDLTKKDLQEFYKDDEIELKVLPYIIDYEIQNKNDLLISLYAPLEYVKRADIAILAPNWSHDEDCRTDVKICDKHNIEIYSFHYDEEKQSYYLAREC